MPKCILEDEQAKRSISRVKKCVLSFGETGKNRFVFEEETWHTDHRKGHEFTWLIKRWTYDPEVQSQHNLNKTGLRAAAVFLWLILDASEALELRLIGIRELITDKITFNRIFLIWNIQKRSALLVSSMYYCWNINTTCISIKVLYKNKAAPKIGQFLRCSNESLLFCLS